jgi:hypothetical protein
MECSTCFLDKAANGSRLGLCAVGICPFCNCQIGSISSKACNTCSHTHKICITCGKKAIRPAKWNQEELLKEYAKLHKFVYSLNEEGLKEKINSAQKADEEKVQKEIEDFFKPIYIYYYYNY